MKSPREHALGLLAKAEHDLVAARATLSTSQAMDMVCFHAQQATEKSLKALLALHDVEYPWRHDLGELLDLVKPFAPEMAALDDRVIQLSPFAVEARYDDTLAPSLNEAVDALQTATEVYDLIARAVQRDESADTA
jgi:HEPN domain-containing protein